MSNFQDLLDRIKDPNLILLLKTQYSCLKNGNIDYSEFMDAMAELLDEHSFTQLFPRIDVTVAKDVKYIIDSLKRHPQATNLSALENVKLSSLQNVHAEITLILKENEHLTRLFNRLWAYFFPLSLNKKRNIQTPQPPKSRESVAPSKPGKKTLYDLSLLSPLDKKSILLLGRLDETVQHVQERDQMQYILKSLKNHSDSNILFYYRIKKGLNLMDVVDGFFKYKYSVKEEFKMDILNVFSNFLVEFPMDKHGLNRAQAHFEYLWNYFFPNLSSRTRRKQTL